MTTSTDPWSAAKDEKQEYDQTNKSEFAPFSLLSYKKVHEAQSLSRRKLHLVFYAIFFLAYCLLTSFLIWTFITAPELVNRSELLFQITELFIVAWMLRQLVEAKNQEGVFHYRFHLITVVLTRTYFWSTLIILPIVIWAILKPNLKLFVWYFDDLTLIGNVLFLLLLIQGARYFRKDAANV